MSLTEKSDNGKASRKASEKYSGATDKVVENSTGNDTDSDTDSDTDRKQKIVKLIRENPKISTIRIANYLSVSKSTVLRDIKQLKASNKLKRIGSEKNGHWEIL